jgi:DNA-binding response OmpR family regulator
MTNILVVDDEERVALSVERSLQREYQVRVAYNGADALKIARRINPHLIILDVMMPGMDGLQVCRELRNDPMLRAVPILFLTARGRLEDKIEGFEAGADDYLTKPFDVRELLLRVKAILMRTSAQRQEAEIDRITVGQLILNCQNYQLSTDEKRYY